MTATLTDIAVASAPYVYSGWNLIGSTKLGALTVNDGDSGELLRADPGEKKDGMLFQSVTLIGSHILSGTLRLVARNETGAGESLGVEMHVYGQAVQAGTDLSIPDATYQEISRQVTLNYPYNITGIAAYVSTKPGHPGGARITYAVLDVTYSPPPNAPTLVAPSGSIGSLTPSMQTSVNNPAGGDTVTHTDIEVRRVSDNALFWASGFLAGTTIGYAGTSLVNGTQYKWRARHRNTYGAEGAWSDFTNFTPSTNQIPVAALLSPIGNATVGTLTPTLQFSYSDPDGDAQTGYQVQVRRYSDQVVFWDPGQGAGAVTSVVYAGTTLVGGTRYEWRARVQDSKGAWSNYSGWESFTPQAAPNPPNSITPSGLQNTLTPTVSGTYNQGTGAAEAAYQYEIRQGGVTIYQSGDVSGAFGTGQAYGTNNPSDTPATPPALAWGTSYEIRARSKDGNGAYSAWSAWQAFSTNAAPTTPTNLAPSGAVTGDTTPTLSWTHNDPNSDAQTEAEVELRKVSDDSAVTGYGPKTLTQSTTTHDVTETLTASPATEYKWRVRTKGTSGPGFGPWSAWHTFTVATAPAFAVDAPTPSQVVAAPALVVEWTMTGGSGTQQSWRVRIYASDQTTLVHDSGVQSGTATSYQLATGILRNSGTYYAQVSGEDTLSQAASSTKVLFTTDWTPPATITGLTAQSIGSQA